MLSICRSKERVAGSGRVGCFIAVFLIFTRVALAGIPGASAYPENDEPAVLQGIVSDYHDGRPLIGAHIVLQDLSTGETLRGAASDRRGFYRLGRIEPGEYLLEASYVGYIARRDTIALQPGEHRTLSLSLTPDDLQLDEVVIEHPGGAARLEAGHQRVRPADLARVPTPSVGGDLVSYLQVLPGVVTTGDRGGQLFVRGGTPSENMVLLDGMLVYQPFHIVGFYSAFPEDLISSADFYAGGYGARYSGRTSSVLDVQMRDGNRQEYRVSGSFSPFLGEVLAEGPIQRGRSSWIVSARHSLIEEIAPAYLGERQPLHFNSQYVKVTRFMEDQTRCSAIGMRTFDRGRFDIDADFDIRWSNYLLGGQCMVMPEEMDYLAHFRVYSSYLTNENRDRGMHFYSNVRRIHTQVDISRFLDRMQLNFGFFAHLKYLDHSMRQLFHAFQEDSDVMLGTGLHLEGIIPLHQRFRIEPGIALNIYPRVYTPLPEPRLRAVWQPFGRDSEQVSAAAGLYYQPLAGISDHRDASAAFTAWMTSPVSDHLPGALHTMVGWQQTLGPAFRWSVEGYFKQVRQMPVTVWSSVARFTTELTPANGQIIGVDLRLEYGRGPVYLMAGYGYSITEYTSAQDHFTVWFGEPVQEYHPPHDRRHQIQALASYDGGVLRTSVRFQFGSGLPFTRPLGFDEFFTYTTYLRGMDIHHTRQVELERIPKLPQVDREYGTQRVILDRPYNGRLPVYHRLDVSVESNITSSFVVNVGAINLYNQSNLFYYDVFTQRRVDQLSFIPYMSLKMEID